MHKVANKWSIVTDEQDSEVGRHPGKRMAKQTNSDRKRSHTDAEGVATEWPEVCKNISVRPSLLNESTRNVVLLMASGTTCLSQISTRAIRPKQHDPDTVIVESMLRTGR